MTFDRDASAGYLVNHMARLFARHLETDLRPLGLALGAFPALLHLWEEDGLTQKELVKRLDIEQPTMANTLARMERDGLIERRRDAADARSQRIYLTDKGRALKEPATAAATDINRRALQHLNPAQRTLLLALIRSIIKSLN